MIRHLGKILLGDDDDKHQRKGHLVAPPPTELFESACSEKKASLLSLTFSVFHDTVMSFRHCVTV
jgi:hypothetical protein